MIILISAALLLYDEGGVTGRGLPSPRGGGAACGWAEGKAFSPGLPLNSLQAISRLVPAPQRPAQPLASRSAYRTRRSFVPHSRREGRQFANMPVAATTQQANADARSEAKAFAKENVHGLQPSSHGFTTLMLALFAILTDVTDDFVPALLPLSTGPMCLKRARLFASWSLRRLRKC